MDHIFPHSRLTRSIELLVGVLDWIGGSVRPLGNVISLEHSKLIVRHTERCPEELLG